MQFISFQVKGGSTCWGVLNEDQVWQLSNEYTPYENLLSVIEAEEEGLAYVQQQLKRKEYVSHFLKDVQLKAPFYPKKNMICVGKNYVEHALEMSDGDPSVIPTYPVLFTKPYTSIIAHQSPINSHAHVTQELDYEGELAVIIGRRGSNISKEEAFKYIFGYSIINDITARDLQKKHQQFFKGKSLDTSAPFGPSVVHQSRIANPQNLHITTYVNEEVRQQGSTKDMIFSIAKLIEVISAGMTLEPGDIIATGTPYGVGKGFKPPTFLKKGDYIKIEIEHLGILENPVI